MSFLSGLIKKQEPVLPPPPKPKDDLIQLDDVFNVPSQNNLFQPKINNNLPLEFAQDNSQENSVLTADNEYNSQDNFFQNSIASNSQNESVSSKNELLPEETNWPSMQIPDSPFEQLPSQDSNQWDEPLPDFTQQERDTALALQEPFDDDPQENIPTIAPPAATIATPAPATTSPPPTPVKEIIKKVPVQNVAHESNDQTTKPVLPFVDSAHYLQMLNSFTEIDHLVEKLNAASTDSISLYDTEQVKIDQMIAFINEIRDSCLQCDESIANAER